MSSNLKKGGMNSLLLLIFCILTLTPSSSYSVNVYKFHQVSMGTVVEVTLIGEDEEASKKAALQAFQEIKRIEYLMSPWVE